MCKFKVGDEVINMRGETGTIIAESDNAFPSEEYPHIVSIGDAEYTVTANGFYYETEDQEDEDNIRLLTKLERALK